ncbi:CHAT domain-containing protein [Okeania sp. SIO2B3]|uniref:CHAT domain-containing protein n=1 Tax=Okeania sp. SIO2B3 TaxID=2607784 RepID=UPI0013BF2DD8|nr:CHAT domain-containing protein [Okeania sp. SIO2B3]NET42368.1 CHAT domain-containing protein [Okeania sp. SIO2B3]
MTQADLLKLHQGQFKLIKTLNYCSLPKLFFSLVLLNCLLALIWSLPITSRSFFTEKNEDLSQFSPADKSLDTNQERGILSLGEHQEKSREFQENLIIFNWQNYPNYPTNHLSREIYFQSHQEQEITFFTGIISRQNFPDTLWNQNIYGVTQQIHSTTNMRLSMTSTKSLKDKTLSNYNNANLISNLTLDTTFEPVVTMLEKNRTQEYSDYFGEDFQEQLLNPKNIQDILVNLHHQTEKKSALISNLTLDTTFEPVITTLEKNRTQEYSDYFGEDFQEQLLNPKNIQDILVNLHHQTGKKSAVIYINVYQNQLQIILLTETGQPIVKTIPEVNREKLRNTTIMFIGEITDFRNRNTISYLPLAKKLYNWLIAPIAIELEKANIDTLLFSIDSGFRLLPLAALHDGKQFLIEKYNLSLIPSFSLINHNYNSLENTQILAMGASKFSDQPALPAVSVELTTITQKLWQGNSFLNEEFTRKNIIYQRQNYSYSIIHLATHAEFINVDVSKSYIQLWNEKLELDQIQELGWNNPEVELLVLSACRTAVGNRNAELGFAGLAIATGVKSAVGSFWLVNDEATLGLMTEFYSHLSNVQIKAEALQAAQLAMLRGEVVIADGTLRGSGSRGEVSLPPELANIQNKNFAHPYYWAGFTMVGSPW